MTVFIRQESVNKPFLFGLSGKVDMTALARLGGIPEEERVIGTPAYNELLIYDNGGFTVAEDGSATIAVLGCGPDEVYPKHHAGLKSQIVQQGGLVLLLRRRQWLVQRAPLRRRFLDLLAVRNGVAAFAVPDRRGVRPP